MMVPDEEVCLHFFILSWVMSTTFPAVNKTRFPLPELTAVLTGNGNRSPINWGINSGRQLGYWKPSLTVTLLSILHNFYHFSLAPELECSVQSAGTAWLQCDCRFLTAALQNSVCSLPSVPDFHFTVDIALRTASVAIVFALILWSCTDIIAGVMSHLWFRAVNLNVACKCCL